MNGRGLRRAEAPTVNSLIELLYMSLSFEGGRVRFGVTLSKQGALPINQEG